MIENMALLKQAMEQMDSEDPEAAQAAKDRAVETLGDANLSFAKIAELIEQRRLLLRPRIVAGLKRMDEPGMLGDAAFRDASSALRREGQSFRQIAEAIELSTQPAPRYETLAQSSEPLHPMAGEPLDPMTGEPLDPMMGEPLHRMTNEPLPRYDMAGAPLEPVRVRALIIAVRAFLRHPIRFLAIALLAFLLFYVFRGVIPPAGVAAVRQRADQAISSVSSFVKEHVSRRPNEVAALPTAPVVTPSPSASPSPSPTSATLSAPPASPLPAPSVVAPASPLAAPSIPSAPPAGPPASPPRRDAKVAPSARSATGCGAGRDDRCPGSRRFTSFEDDRSRALDDIIPEPIRRRSRIGGPCVGGVGGCYWGGIHY
jgi:hypothetical protein